MQESAFWCSFGGSEQPLMLLMEADGSSHGHSSAEPETEEVFSPLSLYSRACLVLVCSWIGACVPAFVEIYTSSTIHEHSPQCMRPSVGAVTGR